MANEQRVVIIGGGIAGLAAALRLADNGCKVAIVEKRAMLGGRASSLPLRADGSGDADVAVEAGAESAVQPPGGVSARVTSGSIGATTAAEPEMVDNCQHVLMRCCVNLLDFYKRIGAANSVEFSDHFTFVDRKNRWSTLSASAWLPAPFHLLPSLLAFGSMNPIDKLSIAYGMVRLIRLSPEQRDNHKTSFLKWLQRNLQTPNAIESFWRPIVVSALNEEPGNTAAAYGFQLFREAFLRTRRGYEMGLPRVTLSEIYSGSGGAALKKKGVQIHPGERVSRIVVEDGRVAGICLNDSYVLIATDIVVSAVPHHVLPALLDTQTRLMPPFRDLSDLETSPITGVHLWFDRSITDVPHVALLGREMQWIFNKGANGTGNGKGRGKAGQGSYLGLVVSASRSLTDRPKAEIVAMALDAIHNVFPDSRSAALVRELVIREKRATFSPSPKAEALRPSQRSPIKGLYLCGDWTQTGWPATMEGAVRSGYLAAESVLHDAGKDVKLLAEEPKADLIPRLLGL